jgi:hypothetical protein
MFLKHEVSYDIFGKMLHLIYCADLTCGAVCVYPNRVGDCVQFLKAAGAGHIHVASGEQSQVVSSYRYSVSRG